MNTLIEIGMTGAQVRSAMNNNFGELYSGNAYNVLSYGIVGDNLTNNTTALQALIETVKVTGGTIYFPTGIYKTNTLTLYWNVTLIGDKGVGVSEIRSISAEPLINLVNDTFRYYNGGLHNLKLNGNGIGTIGFNTQWNGCFSYTNLIVTGFVQYQIYLKGSLVGEFVNCYIQGGLAGVYAVKDTTNVIAPNALTFSGCQFYSSEVGAKFMDGALVRFQYCDFEGNGVSGNTATGSIYHKNEEHVDGKYMVGLIVDTCWFEANYGTQVFIDDNGTNTENLSIITNSLFINNNTTGASDLLINGVVNNNRVIIRDSSLADNGVGIKSNGSMAVVINENSRIFGTISQTNNGAYRIPVDWSGHTISPQIITTLTGATPTGTEIDTVTGLTPATAGAGWQCTIKDSGGGLCYKIESDGTNWQYTTMAIAT